MPSTQLSLQNYLTESLSMNNVDYKTEWVFIYWDEKIEDDEESKQ
jgi:hypothetical protein